MNYNYVLSTGLSTISGSYFNESDRNTFSVFDGTYLSYDASIITGRHSTCIAYNSQTLLEETPVITTGVNKNYYNIFTGNYYLNIESNTEKGRFLLDNSLSVSSSDIIQYDKRDYSTGVALYKTTTGFGYWYNHVADLTQVAIDRGESVSTAVEFQELYDIFLNGQKITQTGEVAELDAITGLAFAISKKTGIQELTNDYSDVYGNYFIENQFDFYINGMEQSISNCLQLYTGVYIVETGLSASNTFNNIETSTYSL